VFTDDTIRPEAAALLAPHCALTVLAAYPPEDTLAAACRDAQGILARLGTVTRRVIESAPKLRIIARHGVGVDAVDLAAATAHGVVVTTTGAQNAAAVAEYTFALLFAALRHVPRADREMRGGAWARNALIGGELDGRTLGVVGLGAIGRRVARAARGFGMRVIAFDPALGTPSDADAELVGFEQLLADADIVTIHTRLTRETERMMSARAFAAMKPTALFVNTARGEVVDEAALIDALATGRIAGAALDTYATEPLAADSPLRAMDNVVLSPHVAGQTDAALVRVAICAAQSILDELAGRRPPYVHNPEVYAVRQRGATRA
jgi:D-3-phosphoglycerate dehydrogenase